MKKIEYFSPEIEVIKLNVQNSLLAQSEGNADIPVDDD